MEWVERCGAAGLAQGRAGAFGGCGRGALHDIQIHIHIYISAFFLAFFAARHSNISFTLSNTFPPTTNTRPQEKKTGMDGLGITPAALCDMIGLIEDGTISGKIAKDVLPELLEGKGNKGERVMRWRFWRMEIGFVASKKQDEGKGKKGEGLGWRVWGGDWVCW